jgi:hypothetical protein
MRDQRTAACFLLAALAFAAIPAAAAGDERSGVLSLGAELEQKAAELSRSNLEHFRGWNGVISDDEQAVLFKSEAFASSARLFLALGGERSDFYRSGYLRTNLYNAFVYLVRSFRDLEAEMKNAGIMPYVLGDCRKILDRMDAEFSRWPSADNLSYLHQKYVKARNAAVYLIERRGIGDYIRRPFADLGSLFRFNYDLKRGKDPWAYLVEVPEDTLNKMEEGDPIQLSFEGCLIIEMSNRPNRPVYLIEKGRKRGITSPAVLQRFGGWGKVLEVPAEVIAAYPDGDPVY